MPPSDLAALRGEPSYIWRAGQERRLQMIAQWSQLDGARVLEAGGGVGTYASQIGRRYDAHVELFDIEEARVGEAQVDTPHAVVAAAEYTPYPANYFDTIISNDVIEHVQDDRLAAVEMVRILKPAGRIVLMCPNRWYPFETHGHYWRGKYYFGNTPLINYLPNVWRDQLAPHVRAYTARSIRALFADLPITIVHHSRIYGAYDNLIAKFGTPMKTVRNLLQAAEGTLLDTWGLDHLLVIEKKP